jgi:oligopeptide/dipeptide ABC transporter ATP-binding protein
MLLSVKELQIYYRVQSGFVKAVDGVSLDIDQGEVVALVGESGSGKTTLALAVSNLLPAPAKVINGSIAFNGKTISTLGDEELSQIRGKEIGMVFQEPASYLNPLIKVGDQIAEALVIHEGLSRQQAASRTKTILEKVRIPDADRVYHYYPHQLSGGMAQRIGIGIAISCDPSLLIADEPTSNLDVTVQAQILHLLKELSRELKLAILLISHDLGVVSGMADRVVIMYAGQIAEEAKVHSIFKNPQHPYTKALLVSSRVSHKNEGVTIGGSLPDLMNPPPGCRFAPRCPYAMSKCEKDPVEFIPEPESRVYCWLYGG